MTKLFDDTSIQFDHPCPIRDVLDRIGDQWSLLILKTLENRTIRFSVLHKEINDISRQMLSRTLKKLEKMAILFEPFMPKPLPVLNMLCPIWDDRF